MYTYIYDNDGKYTPIYLHSNTDKPTTIRFSKYFNVDNDIEFELCLGNGKLTITIAYGYSYNINKGIIDGDNLLCSSDDDVVMVVSFSDDQCDPLEYNGLLRYNPMTIDYYGGNDASVTIIKTTHKIDNIEFGIVNLDGINLIRLLKESGALKINNHELLQRSL